MPGSHTDALIRFPPCDQIVDSFWRRGCGLPACAYLCSNAGLEGASPAAQFACRAPLATYSTRAECEKRPRRTVCYRACDPNG